MQVDPAKRKDKITAPQANIEEAFDQGLAAFNDCVESLSDAKRQTVLEMLDQGTS
ncbi:hypothetical protein N9N16_04940 [Porticoccaceae bacterium]|nr:hypothetical protein [Porticoccaceae bacterium]